MNDKIKLIPKVELHCHLDGSVRVETLYELLREKGAIEEMPMEEFRELASITGSCDSLIEYLERFSYPGQVMQTEENLERISYELLEDLDRDGVMYAEIRFAPYLHMEEGLSFEEVVEAVLTGMHRAEENLDIRANIILIGMRHEEVDQLIDVVEKGAQYLNKGVVGFDIAGNEADFPPELHKKAFDLAKEKGYRITIHAGETGSVENILRSINELHGERLGHGIAAIKDEALMDLLAERGIALEMCPISNQQTKSVERIEDYPIRTFLDRGIRVTVNTDNTTVSNTSLNREFNFLVEEFGLDLDQLIEITRNSIEAAFATEEVKKELRARLDKALEEIN